MVELERKWTYILQYPHDKIGVPLELKCKKTKSMQFPYNFYYQLYFIYVKVLICRYCKYLPLHHLGQGYQKVQKTTILTLSISNTSVEVWVNVIPRHSIVIILCVHHQNKYSHHIFKRVDIALPSSKTHFLAVKMNSMAILESVTLCYITYIH